MSWETVGGSFDEEITSNDKTTQKTDLIREKNEQKRLLQLKYFQNDGREETKAIYQAVMSQFGELLTSNNIEEITNAILTDDCETFLFNLAETVPVHFAFRHGGFIKLFKDKRVIRREVKETFVSLNKETGFQICDCELIDESKGSSMSQFSFEIFSFRDNKLSKYRVTYGSMPMSYGPSNLLMRTKKERMLMKIRELNHAWADQPDLEKIASLLSEGAEYKIYRWKDKKCFTFDKHSLISDFKRCLEEDYVITNVVPYGISCEAQYIYGSYVYHLEGKHGLSGQKFIWVSTCIFSFDQNINIQKMIQQGELYHEGEALIPFQVQSLQPIIDWFLKPPTPEPKKSLSIFDMGGINFSTDILVFGASYEAFTGHIKGFKDFELLENVLFPKDQTQDQRKRIDIFEDLDDPCYESFIVIESNKGTINREGYPFSGKLMNSHTIIKYSFENDKVAKILCFGSVIPDPIPSPFDNINFTDLNFRSKCEFI